jgi:nucleoid-associated protein YgaU
MMDPAVKTATALCVILGGVFAAFLFRNDRPQPTPQPSESEEQLLLRYRINVPSPGARARGAARSGSTVPLPPEASTSPRLATVVTASDRHEAPPPLAQDYPEPERPTSSRWGTSMDMMLPPIITPVEETARTHTVVDGDTLAALAERYLGSASRALEIYNANRDVLSDPKLLPIGVELKLPPRASRAAPDRQADRST